MKVNLFYPQGYAVGVTDEPIKEIEEGVWIYNPESNKVMRAMPNVQYDISKEIIFATPTDKSFPKLEGVPVLELPDEEKRNHYKYICDKLINPVDALSNWLNLIQGARSEQWNHCNVLIEQIKTILDDFRRQGYNSNPNEFTQADLVSAILKARVTVVEPRASVDEIITSVRQSKRPVACEVVQDENGNYKATKLYWK